MILAKVNKIEAHPPDLPRELLSRDFSIPNSGQRKKTGKTGGGGRRGVRGREKKEGKMPFSFLCCCKQRHTEERHG